MIVVVKLWTILSLAAAALAKFLTSHFLKALLAYLMLFGLLRLLLKHWLIAVVRVV